MEIKQDFSLKTCNTFGIDVKARYFAAFSTLEELQELFTDKHAENTLIIGGGSNILFTENYNGLALKNEIKGVDIIKEDDRHIYIRAGAGENWHQFVMFCIERNFAGIENLSLIPGCVGASPMQNIGAYGVEIKDVFHQLEAYHIEDRKTITFSAQDCRFGYRESVFKRAFKGKFVILNVTLRLNKTPSFNTSYGAIEEELEKMQVPLSIRAVSQAVINIRSSKLPDPRVTGNAGSFFKNPVVSDQLFAELQKKYSAIPGYVQENGEVKLAAGWLIEQCGWKGFRKGDAGCHPKQALVLVNYGHARGQEIFDLSEDILRSVQKKFNVTLEREVNII